MPVTHMVVSCLVSNYVCAVLCDTRVQSCVWVCEMKFGPTSMVKYLFIDFFENSHQL